MRYKTIHFGGIRDKTIVKVFVTIEWSVAVKLRSTSKKGKGKERNHVSKHNQ